MKTALIIIDIQNDYFPGGRMELVGAEAAALGSVYGKVISVAEFEELETEK